MPNGKRASGSAPERLEINRPWEDAARGEPPKTDPDNKKGRRAELSRRPFTVQRPRGYGTTGTLWSRSTHPRPGARALSGAAQSRRAVALSNAAVLGRGAGAAAESRGAGRAHAASRKARAGTNRIQHHGVRAARRCAAGRACVKWALPIVASDSSRRARHSTASRPSRYF